MTSPVLRYHSQETPNDFQMEFILPHQFQQSNAVPPPKDPRIKIVEIPQETLAVSTFSGSWDNEAMVQSKIQELRQDATRDGIYLESKTETINGKGEELNVNRACCENGE